MASQEEIDRQSSQDLLGNYIKLKRRERQITQEELGINVGYSPSAAKQAVSQIERGITWLPDARLPEFIEYLHLSEDFFRRLAHYFSIKNYQYTRELLEGLHARELGAPPVSRQASPTQASAASPTTLESQLEKLKGLLEKGLIDEGDYKEAKRDLLKKHFG